MESSVKYCIAITCREGIYTAGKSFESVQLFWVHRGF